MTHIDERLEYYLMMVRLMTEADAQLKADALDQGSRIYSEDLAALRGAVCIAQEAAARIAKELATVEAADGWGLPARRFARH
jgi:hypothetical protein